MSTGRSYNKMPKKKRNYTQKKAKDVKLILSCRDCGRSVKVLLIAGSYMEEAHKGVILCDKCRQSS